MLEQYFVKAETLDRIRASWVGEPVERYVAWLTQQGYAARTVHRRVPLLLQFGEFARERGATSWGELPAHCEAFAEEWGRSRGRGRRTGKVRAQIAGDALNPIRQMLRLVLDGFVDSRSRITPDPFAQSAVGFFGYLRDERGLSERTVKLYRYHLRSFEMYLQRVGVGELDNLSPVLLSSYLAERGRSLGTTGGAGLCAALRVFLRYLWRGKLTCRDLSCAVEPPRTYSLSRVPRSIQWDEVRALLEIVDRRSPLGKRDYAILLLLITYGLRAREVAALTLDDIDWNRERLAVPCRKAGHSTAFPLSSVVGDALVDYLRNGRPESDCRSVFLCVLPPLRPVTYATVSMRVTHYLCKAGIKVPRPGAHTLRHTCVQRLVEAGIPLKTIGDYVGHRSPDSTRIYMKTAIESLRDVAAAGEQII